ncbi:MAG: hypothetical protein WC753_03820 [Candidatus Gracilibacteria bacterium]
MTEKEKISQPENIPEKKTNLSEDFDKWLKLDAQRKIAETQSQLAGLKDDIKEQLRAGNPREALLKYPKRIFGPTDHNYRGRYGSLASIETRSPEDRDKTATSGILTSVLAPFQAIGRIVFDTGKFALSPRKEIQKTFAYLKEESPHTEII